MGMRRNNLAKNTRKCRHVAKMGFVADVACRAATLLLDWTLRSNGAWLVSMADAPKEITSCAAAGAVDAEINRISGLSLSALRVLWRTHFRKVAPKDLSRDLLVRMMAWRIQVQAF